MTLELENKIIFVSGPDIRDFVLEVDAEHALKII
jgi:hypothetical protein